jgi:hypothetical protein
MTVNGGLNRALVVSHSSGTNIPGQALKPGPDAARLTL